VKLSDACPFTPNVACFHVFAHHLAVLGVFAVTRGNVRVPFMLNDACPFSPDVAHFHIFALRFSFLGFSVVTRGNVCVPVTLSDACPFSPDVVRFHIFALRLAVFRLFRCNTGQHMCPCHVKRRLPIFTRHRPFPHFGPSLGPF
jgi:hypothetical protein